MLPANPFTAAAERLSPGPPPVWSDAPEPHFADPTLRVLGIDPGSRRCGWGVVCRVDGRIVHAAHGVVVLGATTSLADRLGQLLTALEAVLLEHRPHVAAVEGVFIDQNVRSALILGHARGVALAALARGGLAVHEYTPQQVKKAVTGTGRAEKSQVAELVRLRLDLAEAPPADAADAVAVAMCHAQQQLSPLAAVLDLPPRPTPASKRKAAKGLEALARARGVAPVRLPPSVARLPVGPVAFKEET